MLIGMFGVGPTELAVIGVVGVLLFGQRLPKVARSLGQSIVELKRGFKEVAEEAEEPRAALRQVSTEIRNTLSDAANDVNKAVNK